MNPITLPAPAKLNLFLHILGRNADGYHRLQTVFQLLDFGDELTFSPTNNQQITLDSNLQNLPAEDNLVVKAARLLQAAGGTSAGIDIHLNKRLPSGGGIGGGSSDAATTLLALNKIWQCELNTNQLAELGVRLGADVPVFIHGHSAWAEGVGEILQPIELPEKWYLVLTPDCAVSTGSIFTHPELTRDTAAITVAAFFEQATRNDCQPLVETLYPRIADCINWLQTHPENTSGNARMTGTGASVFAAFDTKSQAERLLDQSPWPGFVAKGVNRSQVFSVLENSL